MIPATEVLEYMTEEMIAGSVTSDLGIGFGGKDESGSLVPAEREIEDLFDNI